MRYLNPLLISHYFRFGKMDGLHIGILSLVSIVTCHRHVILHQRAKFRLNQTIVGGVMTLYRFFKMADIESESYFRLQFY